MVAARSGERSLTTRAQRAGRRYRARFVFPQPGSWKLTARARGRTFALGSVRVSPRALTLDRAASLIADGDTLLVVETGRHRVLRVDPGTGRTSVVARGMTSPFGIGRSPDGILYVSDAAVLWRVNAVTGAKEVHARVEAGVELGPVAVDAQGRIYVATSGRDVRRFDAEGRAEVVMPDVAVAHGLAFANDGSLLVSDTGRDRVLRYDPATGAARVFATGLGGPGGIVEALDGSVYVCEFGPGAQRVARIEPSGARTAVSEGLVLPIGVAIASNGIVYVDDSTGAIYRLGPAGRTRVRLFAP